MSNSEDKILVLDISALKRFILKLEMEKDLYLETMKILIARAKDVRDKYKYSLRIEEFLQKMIQLEDIEQVKQQYYIFAQEQIEDGFTYADVFKIDFEKSTKESIIYLIGTNKVNSEFFTPNIGIAKYYQIAEALKATGEKVISCAIQEFERFLELFLWELIVSSPKAYLHDKTITYDRLLASNVEELKRDLISQEIKQLMYDTKGTIKKISKIHKFSIDQYPDIVDEYLEMDAHRNIIVHNGGIINEDYLTQVPQKYKDRQLGQRINCSKELIEQKTNNLIKFAYLLFYLWGKSERDLDELSDIAFDLLKKENWEVAEFAYTLLLKLPQLDHVSMLMYDINRLNAKKHMFGLSSIEEEVKKLDLSGMSLMYEVARNLLLDEHAHVAELLDKCYPQDYNSSAIRSWPIFIEFRKTHEYVEFIEKHREDFETYEFKSSHEDK